MSSFGNFNQDESIKQYQPVDQYSNFMQSGGFTQNTSMLKTGQQQMQTHMKNSKSAISSPINSFPYQ